MLFMTNMHVMYGKIRRWTNGAAVWTETSFERTQHQKISEVSGLAVTTSHTQKDTKFDATRETKKSARFFVMFPPVETKSHKAIKQLKQTCLTTFNAKLGRNKGNMLVTFKYALLEGNATFYTAQKNQKVCGSHIYSNFLFDEGHDINAKAAMLASHPQENVSSYLN